MCGVGGRFPVDVDAVEGPVFHECHGCVCELSAGSGCTGGGGEVGGVGPAADAEEDFEVAVVLLEDVKLFDAAISVVSNVVPGIGRIMLLKIRIRIRGVARAVSV